MNDVLFVTKSMGRGGAEANIVDLATTMVARGLCIQVLIMGNCDVGNLSRLKEGGVSVDRLPNGASPIPPIKSVVRSILSTKTRVIHSHMPLANQVCRVLRPMMRAPLVTTEHNNWKRIHWSHRILAPFLYYSDAESLACAKSVADSFPYALSVNANGRDFRGVVQGAAKSAVLPEGVDPEKDILFLNVANVNGKKDHRLLVDSFKRVPERIASKRTVLLIAGGKGDAYHSLAAHISATCPPDRVFLLGPRNDVPSLMKSANALVITSRFEGLPLTVLEAMRLELPIVSVDVGEIGTLLGNSPFLVRSRYPHEIAAAMVNAICHPDRDSLVGAAREFVIARHSIARQVDDLLEIYRRVSGSDRFTLGNMRG